MSRFDVFGWRGEFPYVLDVQADILSNLQSRAVIPLIPVSQANKPMLHLEPVLSINGTPCVLATADISSVSCNRLGRYVTNLDNQYHDEITRALDFLFLGF